MRHEELQSNSSHANPKGMLCAEGRSHHEYKVFCLPGLDAVTIANQD